MARSANGLRLIACLTLLSVVLASQVMPMIAFGKSDKVIEVNTYQHQNHNDSNAGGFYQQGDSEENFTDVEEILNELEEGLINETEVAGPLPLGKELCLRLRESIMTHKRKMEEIRMERRLFMESKKEEMKGLISEFTRSRNEYYEQVRKMIEDIKQLRQEFMSGTITKEEFKAELERMRIELKSKIELMIKLGARMSALMREIAAKNRELALEIRKANREFKEELLQIVNQARERLRNRGH